MRRTSTGVSITRSDEASRSTPDLVCDDEAPEERLVEAVGVLQRIDDREARLGAKKHRRVAVGDVQIDEQRLLPGSSFASAVATLTATVVVPTPPLAPTNA